MNTEYPHDIRRFSDGEPFPQGYRRLTDDEARELDPMTPEQRAEWLKANDPLSALRDQLAASEASWPTRHH